MSYKEIISKVAEDTGLSYKIVDKTYKAYWKAAREYITSLPLKEPLTDTEFMELKPNINIPSIGKLYITLGRYHNVKTCFNIRNKNN